mgnify:CR=1 FL=1
MSEKFGQSPAIATLPLVREWNAGIGADTEARRAALREAMREIEAEESTAPAPEDE